MALPRLHRWSPQAPRLWGLLIQSFGTLKVRMALGVMALLLLAMGLTAQQMQAVADAQLMHGAEAREQVSARRLAAVVGQRTALMQHALRAVADQLAEGVLRDPERLGAFMESKPLLGAMFATAFVASADGEVRALLLDGKLRDPHVNVADRPYFERLLTTGQPVVSAPLTGRTTDEPVVVFAVPVLARSDSGAPKVIGAVAGTLRLLSRDLLLDLTETWDNDDRSMMVITDEDGVILAHPRGAQVMRDLDSEPRLAAAAVQWRREGRPLVSEASHFGSEQDIISMASDPATGWHVWRVGSRAELLAPTHEARTKAARSALLIAIALTLLTVAFVAWQLRPLAQLEVRAQQLMAGDNSDSWPVGAGEIGRLAATLRHVWAERAQAEQFDTHILQKLTSVLGASPVGLVFIRHQKFELFSAECCRLLGYTEDQLVGHHGSRIFPSPDDFDRFRAAARIAFDQQQPYEGEWLLQRADGTTFWARVRSRLVVQGQPAAGAILSLYNIDDQVLMRSELQRAALQDFLTGLANRKSLERSARTFVERRDPTRPVCLVAIDLDRFKAVNDEGGHAAGDEMLRAVAQAISASVRATDVVARVGGDEFALLLPGCDAAHATEIAQQVRQAICEAVVHKGATSYAVGASLGVAELRDTHVDVADWIAAADKACYAAKHAGRNAVAASAPMPLQADLMSARPRVQRALATPSKESA